MVVVDTCLLISTQGEVTRGAWPTVLAAARNGWFELVLPRVVLLEAVDHRRRALDQLFKDREALERDEVRLRRLDRRRDHYPQWLPGVDDRSRLLEDYRQELCVYFSERGEVREHPAISHEELVIRVLAGRKPFTTGEKGYRDALVWYTALELAQTRDVILVTSNTREFADGTELAADLVADVVVAGLDASRIRLSRSLPELLEQTLPHDWNDDQIVQAWSVFATSPDFLARLTAWFEDNGSVRFEVKPAFFPRSMWDTDVEAIDTVERSDVTSVLDADDSWHLITARLHCVAHPGGMIWERPVAWDDVPSDQFVLWSDYGQHQSYLRTVDAHDVDVSVSARFRPPNGLTDLSLDEVQVAESDSGVPPRMGRAGRSLRERLDVLLAEAGDLVRMTEEDPDAYADLVGDEGYLRLIAETLDELATVSERTTPALAADNLGTVLEDPAGVRKLRDDLAAAVGEAQDE